MPCNATSQLTNAPSVPLQVTMPTNNAQWAVFVQRLQAAINATRDAANRQPVNVVPADFAVYNGSTLPALSIIGATSALDTTKHQFGAASLKLTATASTVTVEFSANPILLQPNARWIESVYIQSSRPSIAGTLAIDTPAGSYPVDISGTLLPGTWGRLYGDCGLTADFSTTATMVLTLTGCSVGDTFNLEGWQIEAGTGNLPSPFVNTTVPQTYVDTASNASEALANANAAQMSANQANTQLAQVASDGVLSPAEKPIPIRDYSVVTTEQPGIDAQAVAYLGASSAQQMAYDNAITALTNYLNGLTTPTAWNNKSGNTTIVAATFDATWNTVYEKRQILLNAIYQQAQSLANAAQSTANTAQTTGTNAQNTANTANTTATTANANTPTVINPNFSNGLNGWLAAQGWASDATPRAIYTGFAGASGTLTLANTNNVPCQPGSQIIGQALLSSNAANGACYAGVEFLDSTGAHLAYAFGNSITGTTTATLSRKVALAPASSAFARFFLGAANCTTGTYYAQSCLMAVTLSTLDELPDSGSRFAAAQAGADKTSLNTAADTTKVNGVSSSSISPIATLMPQEAGANKTETRTSALTASLSNQTQDALGDGTTYARMKAASLTGNDFDFAKGGVNKHLGNVPDGGSRYAVINGAGLKAVSSVDANNRAGIDFTQTLHVGKSLANIPDAPGRTAQLRFLLDANIGQNATNWVHVGTLVMANGHSARFTYDGGPGYNADKHNQATSCITVRASNGASVPNLSGISLIEHGANANASVLAVRCAATAGSTSPSNTSWELWTELAAFNGGVLTVDIPPGDSFAFVNAIGADPGAASSTVVVGTGGQYIYTTAGTGLDGMRDGSTYLRMPGANMDANRRGLIDFSQGAHLGKHLGNVPDDPTSTRYAVSNIDGNRRALIDATQAGHVGAWNLDSRVADGTTYARTSTSALTGGNVDLAKAGVVNKNLANIADGGGRYGVHAVDGNNLALIDFSQAGHVNKTIDNVGDGVTYLRMPGANMDANRRGLVDFTQTGHVGKTLANMPDDAIGGRFATRVDTFANRPTAGVQGRLFHAYNQGTNGITYYDTGTAWQQVAVGHLADIQGTTDNVAEGTNKFAGEHGADVTGNHNSATTTKLATARNIAGLAFDGTANIAPTLANIPDDATSTRYAVSNIDGNRRALIDATQAGHVGAWNLDSRVADGTTYARTSTSALTGGNVDLAKAGVVNKNLANIADGGGRYGVHAVDGNNLALIDFSQAGHVNKTIDNVGDGATYLRMPGANMDGNRRGLIDLSQAGHLNKNLDNIADSATYLRTIQQSQEETVDNANFEASAALPPPGWVASGATLRYVGSTNAYEGTQSLRVTTTTQYGAAISVRKYACNVGDVFLVSGAITNFVNTGPALIQLVFFNGSGAFVGAASAVSTTNGWGVYSANVTAPAGSVYFQIYLQNNGAAGSDAWYDIIRVVRVRSLDTEVQDGTTYGRTANADLYSSGGVNRIGLRVPGSGQQVGDQLNLNPITFASLRSVLNTSPITYTITSGSPNSTVNFSVGAFTLQAGSAAINYNASSHAIAQANGTTTTWYLFFIDPTMAGGSQSLIVTTSPTVSAQYNGSVNIGNATVTVASGGGGSSGGGSGGGGFCVADDMFIAAGRRAGAAEIGDPFDCIDLPTAAGKHVRALQGVTRGVEECVRMITSNGCALVCSVSTPFDLPDGRSTTAPHMLGEQVITDLGTAAVVSLALVGPRPVTRAHLGGVSYAAGADPARRIYSHNAGTAKP